MQIMQANSVLRIPPVPYLPRSVSLEELLFAGKARLTISGSRRMFALAEDTLRPIPVLTLWISEGLTQT